MATCDCSEFEDRLAKKEVEIEKAEEMVSTREMILGMEREHLESVRKELERTKDSAMREALKRVCKYCEENVKTSERKLKGWLVTLEMLRDMYKAILYELKKCVSSLIECKACDEEFEDKEECGRECAGCGRWYCINCFDEAIEIAELAAGEAF